MIRVLFIAGCWRSGSTLLGDMLGAIPGFGHLGELHHVWRRGLELDWLCGCGERFRQCGVWSRALAEWGGENVSRAAELEAVRRRMKRDLTAGMNPEGLAASYPQYVEALGKLVEALSRTTGARVLVDSTKDVRHACALMASGRVDLRAVHLIRDPRATVFSLAMRQKVRLDDPDGSPMLRGSVGESVQLWIQNNLEVERFLPLLEHSLTLRYEDLVRAPEEAVKRAAALAGDLWDGTFALDGSPIPPSHSVSGNPDRLSTGARKGVELDDEWTRAMPADMRGFIEKSTRDWMKRYGYV